MFLEVTVMPGYAAIVLRPGALAGGGWSLGFVVKHTETAGSDLAPPSWSVGDRALLGPSGA